MPNLAIPHHMQRGYGYCLPACVKMALAYLGIERSQDDLAKKLGVIADAGVPISRVMRIADRNITVFWAAGEDHELLDALAEGIPPIVAVDTIQLPHWKGVSTYHVVLLAGVEGTKDIESGRDTRTAFIHDPAFPEPLTVSMGDLMLG